MNLMLTAMLLSLLVGLAARQFGRAQRAAIITIAVVMTVLYTFLGNRFV